MNSVKLLIAMVLTMILPSIALAAEETQQLGPYTVSFDMNTDMNYQVHKLDPIATPFYTTYPMVVMTNNNTGSRIIVTEYKNLIDATPDTNKVIGAMQMLLTGFNATNPEDRQIDGRTGFVLIGEPLPGNEALPSTARYTEASYWLDDQKCECGPVSVGTTKVIIDSTYPQDINQGILNSIQVKKGQPAPQ